MTRIDFECAPNIGFKIDDLKLVDVEPYTRKDGSQSNILHWEKKCRKCGSEFTQTSGLRGWVKYQNCKEHREKFPVSKVGVPIEGGEVWKADFKINGSVFKLSYIPISKNSEWIKLKVFRVGEKKQRNNFDLCYSFRKRRFSKSKGTQRFKELLKGNTRNYTIVDIVKSFIFEEKARCK